MAYSPWFPPTVWGGHGGCTWGQPTIGWYNSSDTAVIGQHGKWLVEAGVDFIVVDWSNNIDYPGDPARNDLRAIEDATRRVFEEFATMPRRPRIAILMGSPRAVDYTNGRIQAKANQIYDTFIANPVFRNLYQDHEGKPLLLDYVGTPSPFTDGPPPWNDSRFTVRHMTGFVSEQPNLRDGAVSKYGYWSWEDRGAQTYTVSGGRPEAMVVSAAVRGDPHGWASTNKREGRNNGQTFVNKWNRAIDIGPQIAFVQSFNEWTGCPQRPGEEMSPEYSNDIEPSVELGTRYLDLLREQVTRFKATP
jgi:hypothetical protein